VAYGREVVVFSRSRKKPGLKELKLAAEVGLGIARGMKIKDPVILVMKLGNTWEARMEAGEKLIGLILEMMPMADDIWERPEMYFVVPIEGEEPVIAWLEKDGAEVLCGDKMMIPATIRQATGLRVIQA
jgi:hypothetical protein